MSIYSNLALDDMVSAGVIAVKASKQNSLGHIQKNADEQMDRMATLGDMTDAIGSQMQTGEHDLNGRSAAEHVIRMNTDDWYKKNAPKAMRMKVKAYAGWVQDENGNWVKGPNTYNTIYAQENNLAGFKSPEVSKKDKRQAWKSAGKPAEFRDDAKSKEMTELAMTNTRNAIARGVEESAKASHNIFGDLGGFAQYAAVHGQAPSWIGWLGAQYKANPLLVWGGLAAGVLGISALVSNFLGSRNNQQIAVQQGGQGPVHTTSFWR